MLHPTMRLFHDRPFAAGLSMMALAVLNAAVVFAQTNVSCSGIYPHLAFFNNEGECGTGAVVPWADRLWVVTYGPHKPNGSSDKLYEITPDLQLITRPESVGGTPANRMIHRESQQLNIGPYFIDQNRNVRVIGPKKMPGRLTGTARHLTDPANKLYIATMEEGLYEVDVHSLAVTELIKDGNKQAAIGDGVSSDLPGYHGKGLYSGQGRVIYTNNGENSGQARKNPFVPSGALATWDGSGDWKLIRRNQFTEVTGPGGIYGNNSPDTDPVWSVGWDARSLILMVLAGGEWHSYRLPKASHSYDGAHGWNTEWPRIREIGEDDLLMTMHGMFWRFPKTFTSATSAGIKPRSTFLKVTGDFCRWQDMIVIGCDDTAKNEFLNKRKAKGEIAAPQSQSNLWFLDPEQLDRLGPVIGRGAVWLNDAVKASQPSDPFLIDGFKQRGIHLASSSPVTMTLEVDRLGNGKWEPCGEVKVDGYAWHEIDPALRGIWMRLRSSSDVEKTTAWFSMSGEERPRTGMDAAKFQGVAQIGETDLVGGVIRPRSGDKRDLEFAAMTAQGTVGHYLLNAEMKLVPSGEEGAFDNLTKEAAIPSRKGVIEVDAASVIYIDDQGKRFRLPRNPGYEKAGALGNGRLCREVATERDLFNCLGTFYELPAENAGGFSKVRPVASHNLYIKDYCSYRGLFVLSGIDLEKTGDNRHIIRSEDGKAGLWVGEIDDIWSLGKPVGIGGPWENTAVKANGKSDPYLMTGYDHKTLVMESEQAASITVEIDVSGMGDWHVYRIFAMSPGKCVEYAFPDAFQAYWIRLSSDTDTCATAQLTYR